MRRAPTLRGALGAVHLFLLVLLALACDNAGAYRTVGVTATGVVRGFVFFDANGSGTFDAADNPIAGVRLRLVTPISGDTVLRATTDVAGTFRAAGIPVGSYAVVIDTTTIGDGARVMGIAFGELALRPGDSLSVDVAVGFPSLTTTQVRAAALGTRVFVSGVAFHARATYSDTLLHVADTSGALRAMRVRPTAAVAGDSVRMRGRVALRDGQKVLDDVTVYVLGATFLPPVATVSTLLASSAGAGALDAALVRLLDAVVIDTATVLGSLTVRVNDGSGVLTILLDRVADAAFRAPYAVGSLAAGARYDVLGVLVPKAGGGWTLRPRGALDLTPR